MKKKCKMKIIYIKLCLSPSSPRKLILKISNILTLFFTNLNNLSNDFVVYTMKFILTVVIKICMKRYNILPEN